MAHRVALGATFNVSSVTFSAADGLLGDVHDHVAVVATPGQTALRHAALNNSPVVTITMKIEWDPFTEVPLPRVLEMQMHMRSAAVAGVADSAKQLASYHTVADRNLYRTGLQVPNGTGIRLGPLRGRRNYPVPLDPERHP